MNRHLSPLSQSNNPPPRLRDAQHPHILLALCLFLGSPAVVADSFVRLPDLPTKASISWFSSWGDYDNDGYPDLVVANGGTKKAEFLDLYRNRGDGTFESMTADRVGTIVSDAAPWGTVVWMDVNNDGWLDLIATADSGGSRQAPRLFLNQGDGSFHSVPAGDLTNTKDFYWSVPPADFNGDGWVDIPLLVNNYTGARSQNRLLLNRSDVTFDLALEGAIDTDRVYVNTAAWADYDNDGDPDLFLANFMDDNVQHRDRLYRNDGRGVFTSVTNTPLVESSGGTYHVAWGDFDHDGDLDGVVTKMSGRALLFINDQGVFSGPPITLPGPAGEPMWVDYDNDGYLDLFMSRGQGSATTNVLLRNLGHGSFTPVKDVTTTEVAQRHWSSWGDLDNDGFMDVFMGSPLGRSALYRNLGNTNHWLKLRLKGSASNAAGIGATVRVRATIRGQTVWQMQQVGGGAIMQNDLRPNFGLGDATKADEVRIEWPSGNVMTLTDLAANQVLELTEETRITPVRPVATIDGNASLTGSLLGLGYQWYFEGAALEGKTARSLTVSKAQPAQAGRYSLVTQTDAGLQTNHVYLRLETMFTKVLEGEMVTESTASSSGAWFDYDGDGFLDLIVPSVTGPRSSLFHNLRNGSFERITNSPVITKPANAGMAAAADFNNDGKLDLLLMSYGAAKELYRGDGAGGFTALVGQPFNLDTAGSWDVAWMDYNRDGLMDLLTLGDRGATLYRNGGNDTFIDTAPSDVGSLVVPASSGNQWSCIPVDYDADGDSDVIVMNSTTAPIVHRNLGNGSFAVAQVGSLTSLRSDFACAMGDYDNDGFLDAFTGHWREGMARLHRNQGGTHFEEVAQAGDLQTTIRVGCPSWVDFDNDGFLDLLFLGYDTPSSLYRNRGDGTFESLNVGNLLTDGTRRSQVIWGDYDHNGFPDMYVVCGDGLRERNSVYRNNGNGNHWLDLQLAGTTSNGSAIGAKVRVQATIGGRTFWQLREIASRAGSGTDSSLQAHFGLGNATHATKVRIEWPSGIVQELARVAADQFLAVTEPPPIRLTASLKPNGIRLECRGIPNASYSLETSNDLRTWTTRTSLLADPTGLCEYTAPVEAGTGSTFYRVVGN